jgi:Uncharacterized protein conserved in bacteria (DUF2330)
VNPRHAFVALSLAASTFVVGPNARAMGAIVSSPPGSAAITEVRVAVSTTPTRTTRWVSLHVHGAATTFAWIVPVSPSGFVDLASDAWLESLEVATAPRVLPPVGNPAPPACNIVDDVDLQGNLSHVSTSPPTAVAVAPDAASLTAALAGWGLAMPVNLVPPVDAAGAEGDSFVALLYTQGSPDTTTRTLRVVDSSAPTFPLEATAGATAVQVTAYSVLGGSLALGGVSLPVAPPSILWQADGTSTYAAVTAALLGTSPGAWVLDSSSQQAVFVDAPSAAGMTIPALAGTYFLRAEAYGDTTASAARCDASAISWSTNTAPAGAACPSGALASIGTGASCTESTGTGQIAPDTFKCGAADDFALALSGLAPASVWLSRSRTVLTPEQAIADAPVEASGSGTPPAGAPPFGPDVPSWGYVPDVCASASTSSGGSGGGGSYGSTTAGGGTSGTGDNTAGNVGAAAGTAASGCGGSSAGDGSDDSGCDGDSSGSDADDSSDCDAPSGSSDDCAMGVHGTVRRAGHGGRGGTTRALLILAAGLAMLRRRRHAT